MPVASISMRLRIGGIQILARPGTFTTRSNSSISFSGVIPGRHDPRGLKRMVVSNISRGAGSVALSARPALPNTLSTSGTVLISRSEEHTSELQSLMRNSYAVFCLKKNTIHNRNLTIRRLHEERKRKEKKD